MKATTILMDDETWRRLHDEHAHTYDKHRLSFNAWLIAKLMASLKPPP